MQVISPFWSGALELAGSLDLQELATLVGGWQNVDNVTLEHLEQVGVPCERAVRWLRASPLRTVGYPLTQADPGYPPLLRMVPSAPAVLFVEGDRRRLLELSVAVVGTRRCTPYGSAVARHLGSALSQAGVCVLSGLALGIDTHAHRGALPTGRTVAVLGHGLSHTSPASNRGLRREILHAGGAVVSSWPDDLAPRPWTFPVRNRWIAGLAAATIVVQAPARSGALITATDAASVGRDVYAVPHGLGQPGSEGCLQLLAMGAKVVLSVDDVVSDFSDAGAPDRSEWLGVLFDGGSTHQAARVAGVPVTDLLVRLARLEVEGKVVRLPGQRYAPGRGCT